ncbi:MAG: beta-RFAP synthase [Isosphaeraceae bacterium]|nr:beta-RFAP synthase [Isosphaeraceae bacterium]
MNLHAGEIQTGSRLHFGLLGWGEAYVRQFGGLGLMIEEPALRLAVAPSEVDRVVGSTSAASRITELMGNLRARGFALPPVCIEVLEAPREHVGLGSGTQLSLAAACLLLDSIAQPDLAADRLAELTARGRRSGVGLHGFLHGGLIVDGGRSSDSVAPPLLARYEFPSDWSVLVVIPEGPTGLHGVEERRAFRELPSVPTAVSDRLCRLVLLELLPALIERDLPLFGEALERIQRLVGETFAPAQGGVFANNAFDRIAAVLRDEGCVGIGQSSWGPALYGFRLAGNSVDLDRLAARCGVDRERILVTKARNRGAELRRSSGATSVLAD